MRHTYYSQRAGLNPAANGLELRDVVNLFVRVFEQLEGEGYFDEAFGFQCVDAGHIDGKVVDVELEIVLSIRKKHLWPVPGAAKKYTEDDFFDVVEFLYQHVSKPIDGHLHDYNGCGMHWNTFNQAEGRSEFSERVNRVLEQYERKFELSATGEVLQKPEAGFEPIFDADVPSKDGNVTKRISSAVLRYRRHGSTLDDRRQAVRDLAEYARPGPGASQPHSSKGKLTKEDRNTIRRIQELVTELGGGHPPHKEICDRLDAEKRPLPSSVRWPQRSWCAAYNDAKLQAAVRTWISKAIYKR